MYIMIIDILIVIITALILISSVVVLWRCIINFIILGNQQGHIECVSNSTPEETNCVSVVNYTYTKVYNEMKQPIIHKGQLNKGDTIYFNSEDIDRYIVIECKDNCTIVENFLGIKRDLEFIDGKGWVYKDGLAWYLQHAQDQMMAAMNIPATYHTTPETYRFTPEILNTFYNRQSGEFYNAEQLRGTREYYIQDTER